MGLFSKDVPASPDPIATAGAQTGTNVSTSVANAFLNNTNQVTPQGSLQYDVTNKYDWTDPSTGQSYSIPRFTASQFLSPDQQQISNLNVQADKSLAGLAAQQSGSLQGLLGTPYDPSKGNFSAGGYLAQNPDVAAWAQTTGDPYAAAAQHYRQYGQNEGRGTGGVAPPPMGDIGWLHAIGGAQGYIPDVGGQQRSVGPYANQQTTFGNEEDYNKARTHVEEALYKRMDPQLQRDRAAMEARLADQGIKMGSPAHQAAMDQFNRQLTDTRLGITQAGAAEQQQAFMQALGRGQFANQAQMEQFQKQLQGGTFANQAQQQDFQQAGLRTQAYNAAQAQNLARNQALFNAQNQLRGQTIQEQQAARNQPINEITALLSGSQVQQPNWIPTNNQQIPTTDVAGLINNRFSQDMDAYKQQSANFNSLMGGIFGALGGVARSDRRVKEDIDRVGTVFAAGPDGEKPLPIYEYAFKDDPQHERHTGPMAQDVEKIDRKAVKTIKGVKYIDKTRMGSILKAA